ncbi:MAG: CRISPR-associated endonuclease Cas1 [Planctomycetota bacterium]
MATQRPLEPSTAQTRPSGPPNAGGSQAADPPTSQASGFTVDAQRPPDYLPARMLNEYTYCPRLFYYEHVEGIFVHNRETVEGSIQHKRVDGKEDELPPAEELLENQKPVRMRSVTLSSETLGVIAKMDLIETDGQCVVPVDYKRGQPFQSADGSLQAWDTDRTQLAVQALILRDHGYCCEEAVVYYAKTKQRVRILLDDTLVREALRTIEDARRAVVGPIPPPLSDSPKCPRCSLVSVCLPDETNLCTREDGRSDEVVQLTLFDLDEHRVRVEEKKPLAEEVRRLVAARDDLRPLYLNTQGLYVGKSGQVLQVKEKRKLVQEVRINEICQLNLMGNIQISTQAIQTLCQAEIAIAYFSMGGWFYGVTQGLGVKNIFLRREQFRLADVPSFCLRLARAFVAGKIRNQRTLLQRNHVEPPRQALVQMKCMQEDAERATSMEQLLGIEGNAARVYFENFAGMIKVGPGQACEGGGHDGAVSEQDGNGSGEAAGLFTFDFDGRNRRPPRDPVNALLSLAYSLLAKDLTITARVVGFDPFLGYYHQPRFGRASLALDLMEPFRPLIADSAVLSAINTRIVSVEDFVRAGNAVALTPGGRKKFFRAYEQRMDALVTHPLFGYRVNYRRMLEIQTRLLARLLTGEMAEYPVFTTR